MQLDLPYIDSNCLIWLLLSNMWPMVATTAECQKDVGSICPSRPHLSIRVAVELLIWMIWTLPSSRNESWREDGEWWQRLEDHSYRRRMRPASIEACLHRLGLTACQLDDADDVSHVGDDDDDRDRDDDDRDDHADHADHAESDLIGWLFVWHFHSVCDPSHSCLHSTSVGQSDWVGPSRWVSEWLSEWVDRLELYWLQSIDLKWVCQGAYENVSASVRECLCVRECVRMRDCDCRCDCMYEWVSVKMYQCVCMYSTPRHTLWLPLSFLFSLAEMCRLVGWLRDWMIDWVIEWLIRFGSFGRFRPNSSLRADAMNQTKDEAGMQSNSIEWDEG